MDQFGLDGESDTKGDNALTQRVRRPHRYLPYRTAVVGLIPVVGVWIDERYRWRILWLTSAAIGDLSDIALNYYLVVRKCRQAEIPDWLLRKMLMNNAVSAGLGLVPVAGKEISPKSRLD